jgi:nucleotide-binding universal stress UspA family protein
MIPEITEILFATDLSKNSLYAFGYAVQLARQCNARITVLNAVDRAAGTLGSWVKEETEKEELVRSTEAIRSYLERFCEVMDPNRTCIEFVTDILVRVGEPVQTILDVAQERNSDILVLGKHAKGKLKNTLLGSVSQRVLDRASRPVVVISLPKDNLNWEELER